MEINPEPRISLLAIYQHIPLSLASLMSGLKDLLSPSQIKEGKLGQTSKIYLHDAQETTYFMNVKIKILITRATQEKVEITNHINLDV